MNRFLPSLIIAALGLFSLAAISVTESAVQPWRIQVDLTFNADGSLKTAAPQVFFGQTITIDGQTINRDLGSVTWDSVAKRTLPISIKLADGSTATTTRGAVLAAIIAAASEERAAQATP